MSAFAWLQFNEPAAGWLPQLSGASVSIWKQ